MPSLPRQLTLHRHDATSPVPTSGLVVAVLCLLLLLLSDAHAGDRQTVTTSVFADFYLGRDTGPRPIGRRPSFLYNHTETNEPQLNLGLARFEARAPGRRASLGLMAGSYSRENLAHEPAWARHLFEANAGLALDASSSMWLDVGVLPSHIGFESAISSQNPTLTRSLAAENSPYYLTGARFSWDVDDRLKLAALVVTGWQRIRPVHGNSLPGFGTQVTVSPSRTLTLNWSTFVGTDDPDSNRRLRYFNNVYAQVAVSASVALTAGLDVGLQQRTPGSNQHDLWSSAVMIARFQLSPGWATALRAEHYRDTAGVIVSTSGGPGLRTWGCSWNIDWRIHPGVLARFEVRHLADAAAIYARSEDRWSDTNTSALGSLALEF